MKVSVHLCLLDKDCRKDGAPAHLYVSIGRRVIRFNPPYSSNAFSQYFRKGDRWTWHVVQTWRRAPDPVVSVHRLTSDEWQVLKDLRVRSLTDSPDALLGDLEIERDLREGYWRAVIEHNAWVVASIGARKRAIGLAKLNLVEDEAYAESLWVAPLYRRNGAARLLVAEIEKIAVEKGVTQLHSWILVENRTARKGILKLGFRSTLERQLIEINGRTVTEERCRKNLGT